MNLTDEELRIKVAEACGWTWATETEIAGKMFHACWTHDKHGFAYASYELPNYPLDLNACAEFEATLTDEEKASYVKFLNASHPTSDIFHPNQNERGFNNKLAAEVFGLVAATAAQRAEAFLRTLNLWTS